MSTLLNKPTYVIKLSMKGEGGVKKVQKSVYVVYGSPLRNIFSEFQIIQLSTYKRINENYKIFSTSILYQGACTPFLGILISKTLIY